MGFSIPNELFDGFNEIFKQWSLKPLSHYAPSEGQNGQFETLYGKIKNLKDFLIYFCITYVTQLNKVVFNTVNVILFLLLILKKTLNITSVPFCPKYD